MLVSLLAIRPHLPLQLLSAEQWEKLPQTTGDRPDPYQNFLCVPQPCEINAILRQVLLAEAPIVPTLRQPREGNNLLEHEESTCAQLGCTITRSLSFLKMYLSLILPPTKFL